MVLWYFSRSAIKVSCQPKLVSHVFAPDLSLTVFLACARNDSNTESHNQTLPNRGRACRVCCFPPQDFWDVDLSSVQQVVRDRLSVLFLTHFLQLSACTTILWESEIFPAQTHKAPPHENALQWPQQLVATYLFAGRAEKWNDHNPGLCYRNTSKL